MSSDGALLFVYGSLRRGERNHRQMAGAQLEKSSVTLQGYRKVLYESGYPAIHRSSGHWVAGETYRVTPEHLKRLDKFEECPELYQREVVMLANGDIAFAYVISFERGSELPEFPEDG